MNAKSPQLPPENQGKPIPSPPPPLPHETSEQYERRCGVKTVPWGTKLVTARNKKELEILLAEIRGNQ